LSSLSPVAMFTLRKLNFLEPDLNSVLHLSRSRLPHETTINITKSLRVWARAISLCFVLLQTLSFSLLLPFFRGSIVLHPPKLLLAFSLLLRLTTLAHVSNTPSFHSIPIRPVSVAEPLLQVAVSKARQSTCSPNHSSVDARFRYSPRTSGSTFPPSNSGSLSHKKGQSYHRGGTYLTCTFL